MHRSYLILQGPGSPIFGQLAAALLKRGHVVRRVNFCGGDLLYGGSLNAWNYSGASADLPAWYTQLLKSGNFTDVIMFGDCREIHRHMHPLSRAFGLRVHVFEEGYVRPYWLTLERHGVNGRSQLSRDPAWYLEQRKRTPHIPAASPTGYNLYERVFHDIRYRTANLLYAKRFPHYRSHQPTNGVWEYGGLAARALRKRPHDRNAEHVTRSVLAAKGGYYIFPLQLNSDAQIVVHSPFDSVRDAIEKILHSFARFAPADTEFVIRNHPLDMGPIDYRRHAEQIAVDLDIKDRLRFIDAGHLPTLLENARGAVVVNSTVGLSALHHSRPVIALGTAIYSLPGLTWQGELDDFWLHAEQPDTALYQAFLDYVVHHTQINGDLYTRTGIVMAIAGAVPRLESERG
ncbi:capsular biosynthesis protein [Caballeronia sp. LjRoot34]|uniref:capsule biosynthesis protein n=1 Tax=Caballeronia sp. LjRoot34 TaxID=3342325 RepID=UPI003ED159A5